jgi:hypothetical protein
LRVSEQAKQSEGKRKPSEIFKTFMEKLKSEAKKTL